MANRTDQTRRIAISGILAAFSLVLLWLSSVMPTGRWGLIAAAGLLPAAAIISTGLPGGIFCWLTTGILAMILLPDKMNALLYLFLFGLYPIVKYLVERMRKLPIEKQLLLSKKKQRFQGLHGAIKLFMLPVKLFLRFCSFRLPFFTFFFAAEAFRIKSIDSFID
jgi:hypothetical protein